MQSLSNGNDKFVEKVRSALRRTGHLLPITDEEVEQALEFINAEKRSAKFQMSDPYQLFRAGKSKRSVKPVKLRDHSRRGESIEQSLALAAREGSDIPEETREKMNRDRDHAERTQMNGTEEKQ